MRFFLLACLVLAGVARADSPQLEANVDTEQKPWTNLTVNNAVENFPFVVVTDRTGGHRQGVFLDGVRKINLLQPEFVVSIGDLIEGYTEDVALMDKQWEEFNGFVAELDMPFFYVPGNHDISNPVMSEDWNRRFGTSYYHFRYQDVLFLCLNSEDPPKSQISDEQVAYVEQALKDNVDVRWTLVFLHKPLWIYDRGPGWEKVETMLSDRPYTAFAGHTHHYFERVVNDRQHITLGTMGGGSSLRGDNFGEFDHFAWVTMTADGPIIANLQLDGIWDAHILNDERLALIQPLLRGTGVVSEGIVVDRDDFTSAETKLRLTNDANLPMKLDLVVMQDKVLRSSRQRITRLLDPNSVETITLKLDTKTPVDPATLRPLRVAWTARYDVPDNVNPVVVEGTHRIVVDTTFPIAKREGETVVDGKLDEWGTLAVLPAEPGMIDTTKDAWYGNGDASVRFSVAEDKQFLYVAAHVLDDERHARPKDDYNKQDSLEIRIDARPEDKRVGGGAFKEYLMLGLAAGQKTENLFKGDQLPEGTRMESVMTDDGYTVEAAIPLAYFVAQGGEGWSSLRINFCINDFDPDGDARVWWRPNWHSAADYAGSGTFARQ